MTSEQQLGKIITEAISLYNRYHAPEATASEAKIDEASGIVEVVFEGSFCETCGIRDWVEDFAYVLKGMGVNAKLIKFIEPGNNSETKRIGVFRVEKEGVTYG